MGATSDVAYADHLVKMLRADRARLVHEPRHASVVLWMVEELRTAAATLRIDRGDAKALLIEAAEARADAIEARKSLRKSRRAA